MTPKFPSRLALLTLLAALAAGTAGLAQPSFQTPTPPAAERAALPATWRAVYAQTRAATVRLTSSTGLGTGFLISEDGLVMTAAHVALGNGDLIATTAGGDRYPATLVGYDEFRDVALLRVRTDARLPFLRFAAASPGPGYAVLAVGNSRGAFNAPRAGNVLAQGRTLGPGFAGGLIATTMPLAPGDSGGPVVNSQGEVVGVSSAIGFSRSGFASYVTPVTRGSQVLADVRAGEKRGVPFLGIGLVELSPRSASALGLSSSQGVLVTSVAPGSGAQQAGLRGPRVDERTTTPRLLSADVITAVDGRRVQGRDGLVAYLRTRQVGDRVRLTVQRGEQTLTLTVTLGSRAGLAG